MTSYNDLFANNRRWLDHKKDSDPDFFKDMAQSQDPDYLYIGCSDSRVTPEGMMGLGPGEVFVHRNVGNLVNNVDLNVMTSINYAVKFLNVKHIIVCGHYNCGGVKAALEPKDLGILNPWLRTIRDVYRTHKKTMGH